MFKSKRKNNFKKFCDEIAPHYSKDRLTKKTVYKSAEEDLIRRNIKKDQKILDLCCGPGTYLVPLTKANFEVEGMDFSKNMIYEAKKFAKGIKVKIKISIGNACCIKRPNQTYDIVLLMGDSIGSIGNLALRKLCLKECYRVLNKEGLLLLSAGRKYFSLFHFLRIAIFYFKSLFTKGNVEFGDLENKIYNKKLVHHYFSKKELILLLKKTGFRTNKIYCIEGKFICSVFKG